MWVWEEHGPGSPQPRQSALLHQAIHKAHPGQAFTLLLRQGLAQLRALGEPLTISDTWFLHVEKKKKIKGFRLDQVRFSSFLTLTHIQKNVLQHMTHRITLRAITQVPGCQCLHKRKVHFSHNCQCEVSGFVGGSPPHSDPGTQPP